MVVRVQVPLRVRVIKLSGLNKSFGFFLCMAFSRLCHCGNMKVQGIWQVIETQLLFDEGRLADGIKKSLSLNIEWFNASQKREGLTLCYIDIFLLYSRILSIVFVFVLFQPLQTASVGQVLD